MKPDKIYDAEGNPIDDNIVDAEFEEVPSETLHSGHLPEDGDPEMAPAVPTYSFWIDIAAIMGVLIAAQAVGYYLAAFVRKTTGAAYEFGTFCGYAFTFLVTIGFALWLLRRRMPVRPLLNFSLRRIDPSVILWGVILVFVVSVVIEPLLSMFPDHYYEALSRNVGRGGWAVLTTVLLAPLLEEVLFRGILQGAISANYGKWKGLLAASLIFGIIHCIPPQALNAIFVGLILGYIYIKTESLIPCIVIHAINNALAYILMVIFEEKALMTTRMLIDNDLWYWIVYSLCLVLFAIAAFNLWSQIRRPGGASAPEGRK